MKKEYNVGKLAQSIVDGKKEVWIEGRWFFSKKYIQINGVWPLALLPHRDQCRIAMPHLEMSGDPPEYEIALAVIKEVKRLTEEGE